MPALSGGEALRRALLGGFAGFDGDVNIDALVSCPWASVTFSGERHVLRLSLHGAQAEEAANAFLFGLSEREFGLRGHILADIVAVAEERDISGGYVRLTLEALTVES